MASGESWGLFFALDLEHSWCMEEHMKHTEQPRILPACPWCSESHNPDIECRQTPKSRSEVLWLIARNTLALNSKLAAALAKGGK